MELEKCNVRMCICHEIVDNQLRYNFELDREFFGKVFETRALINLIDPNMNLCLNKKLFMSVCM